ncbi:MAG: hypothetical protein KC416_15090, partial [Myxococcales bacterium]|nr:hypothetical protein [Myxococcales bacterium]
SGNCFINPDNCLDDVRTISTVEQIAMAGIPTYVIGYDTATWQDTLNAMAAAGGTERTTYLPVDDGTSLESTLAELAGTAVSCNYELKTSPSDFRFVKVKLDGSVVEHVSRTQDGSGWELTDDNHVVLKGATCDALRQSASPELEITVECEVVVK